MPALDDSDTGHERVPIGRWHHFLTTARPHLDPATLGPMLCLDPGETTGWAIFDQGILKTCGQWSTYDPSEMSKHIAHAKKICLDLQTIVYEEYRVRGNKFKEHVGSEIVTIQHIGAIKVAADFLGLDLVKQTAGQVKQFATDSKLRRWGLYQTNQRHANDAIRHGVYYILFASGRHMPNGEAVEAEA